MKNLLIIPFILWAFAQPATAFEWHQANETTIAWDAVETLADGAALPTGDAIKYQVYTRDGDGVVVAIREVDATQALLTFTVEGNFIVGVSSVRYRDDVKLSESVINWSDVNGGSTPDPFGFSSYQNPAQPLGLRTP